jgi:hypothetical protein
VTSPLAPTRPDPLDSQQLHRLLPGLRTALDAGQVRGVVQDALFADHGRDLVERCRPGKVLYAGPDDCRLRYALDMRDTRTGRPWSTTLIGRLFTTPQAAAAYARDRAAPVAARMRGRADVGRFPTPVTVIPSALVVLHPFPVDPSLPTLVDATDPNVVEDLLRQLPDAAPDGSDAAHPTVEVVRYPRQGRCVLRYVTDGRHPVYAKVYADASGSRVRSALAALRGPRSAHRPPFDLPPWLGYRVDLRATLLGEVPGEPTLRALLRAGREGDAGVREQAREEVAAAARVLAAIHSCVPPPRPRTVRDDLAALFRELLPLGPVAPAFSAETVALLDRLADAADRGTALDPCCAHGDYTPTQLLSDGSARGIVDVDTLCLAEPALDVGQFLAYLRVALSGQGGALAGDLAGRFLDAYVAARGLDRDHARALGSRVRVYQAVSLARLAVRGWLQLKGARVRAALTVLSEEEI